MIAKKPSISVIIPVYNVEHYLRETIDSVIAQDIGFLENIEIILINDGSTDDSESICLEYADRYPNSIKYLKQKNAGVSVARNKGIELAKGTYVHFLDSDDIISRNTYSEAVSLLENHVEEVDFAAIKIEFFDAKFGSHPLNYKFSTTRIIDIDKEPSAVIMHMPTCIIRRSAIKTKFVKGIEISEDSRFISEILINKKAYGVLGNAIFYYRKRKSGESAIDTSRLKKSYYQITPVSVYRYILDLWTDGDNQTHLYAQNLVAYDIQWRIRQRRQKVLSESEEHTYKKIIYSLIQRINDRVIVSQRSIGVAEKEFLLKIKNTNNKVSSKLRKDYLDDKRFVSIDLIKFEKNKMIITGHTPTGSGFTNLTVAFDNKTYIPESVNMYYKRNEFLGDVIYDGGGFRFILPVQDCTGDIQIFDNDKICEIVAKRHSRIPNFKNGYMKYGNKLVVNKRHSFTVRNYSIASHMWHELLWSLRIIASLKLRYSAEELYRISRVTIKKKMPLSKLVRPFVMPLKAFLLNARDVLYRAAYYVYKTTKKRPVWIISDRVGQAGDNGEALFRFLSRNRDINDTYDIYFSIDATSREKFEELKLVGKVVDRLSFKYKMLFLCADKIISSHAEDNVYNAFGGRAGSFVDLYKFDFIFLQHGVTKDDLSSWINIYAKNIRLFITSTEKEKASITDYKYGYTQKEVVVTGMPRYDNLDDSSNKTLLIMPTWRANLVPAMNQKTGHREYDGDFINSDFYKFYSKLVSDPKLARSLKSNGYTAELYLHPNLSAQIDDFKGSDTITIMTFPHNYKDAFRRGRILITDYSSVAFDFGYMKKPIVYTHFDKESFFEGQVYNKGYFSYERDGFGPVLYDYDSSISKIIQQIEADGRMPNRYKQRVERFFKYTDRNNSKRVFEQIVKIGDYEN